MSRNTRLALGGAVLLLLCACLAMFAGRLPEPPVRVRLDLQAPSLSSLRARLAEQLRSEDVTVKSGAGCAVRPDSLEVPPNTACEFSLPTSSRRGRQLVVSISANGTGGTSVMTRLLQRVQNQPVSADQPLRRGDDPLPLDIYRCDPRSNSPFAPDACRNEAQRTVTLTVSDCVLGELPKELQMFQPKVCSVQIGR